MSFRIVVFGIFLASRACAFVYYKKNYSKKIVLRGAHSLPCTGFREVAWVLASINPYFVRLLNDRGQFFVADISTGIIRHKFPQKVPNIIKVGLLPVNEEASTPE